MAAQVTACVIDTHPLVWWLVSPARLSKRALATLADPAVQVHVPTMAILEFQYLIEIGRIDADIRDVLAYVSESDRFHLMPCDASVLSASIDLQGTRDPFDRIIASSALSYRMPLVTRDRWMRDKLGRLTVW